MNLAKRVKRGAKYLDKNSPGWEQELDLDILELSNPSVCILGQALGGFYSGMRELGLSEHKAEKLGFSLKSEDFDGLREWGDEDQLWSMLTEEWVRLVDNRLHPNLDNIPEPPRPTITVTFSTDANHTQMSRFLAVVEQAATLLPEGTVNVNHEE